MSHSAQPSDAALVIQVLEGQRDRFGDLVERHLPSVYAVAFANTRNHSDAEDVSQEAFLRAFRSLDTLKERAKFGHWLVTITRNAAMTLRMRRKKDLDAAQSADVMSAAPAPDVARRELLELVREKIGQLDETHREVLVLHYLSGESTAKIAETLDISRNAVKKRLQRAREALSAELLDDVRDAVEPVSPYTTQHKRIITAIAATTVAWEIGTAAAAAATSVGMGFGARLAAAVVIGSAGLFGAAHLIDSRSAPESEKVTEREPGISNSNVASYTRSPSDSGLLADRQSNMPARATAMGEKPENPTDTNTPPTKNTLETLQKRVGLVFEDVHISELLEFLQETYKLELVLDNRVVLPLGSSESGRNMGQPADTADTTDVNLAYRTNGMIESVDLRDVSLMEILETLLYPGGLAFVEEPGFVWISTPELIAKEVVPEPIERYDEYPINYDTFLKETTGSIAFRDIHVEEVLDFLRDTYKINISLDHRAVAWADRHPGHSARLSDHPSPLPPGYVTSGVIPYVNVKGIQARDVLKIVLRPLNLGYIVDGDRIVISSHDRIAARDFPE